MTRTDWPTFFANLAELWATRSTCLRRQVGAVIVKNKHVVASGYNGAPAGTPHCEEVGCLRKDVPSGTSLELCRATHAEQNALAMAARYGISVDGADIYVTDMPCITCAKLIINAGIKNVIYVHDYPNSDLSKELLREAKVGLSQFHF